ncbi:MAG: hypothetical protein N2749_04875 [Clostridia bacterium]|nr:hypothetical protein [Clostridia bacterium]
MINSELATEIHDICCPKCTGNCRSAHHSNCAFDKDLDISLWSSNIANNYFLELAQKAAEIIEELGITEEEFLENLRNPSKNDIFEAMIRHGFN